MFNIIYWILGAYTGKMSNKRKARLENDQAFMNVFYNLLNLSLTIFEYDNLPETCSSLFLETALLSGKACLVKDPELGFLTLKANTADGLNIYGLAPKFYATGVNGYSKEYINYIDGSDNTFANGVICKDNPTAYPYIFYLFRASERLTSAERSLDVASKKLKNPYFITADETQVASVKKILSDVDANEEAIIANKSTMPESFKVFPTNVDTNTLTTLWQHYNNLNNQIRVIFGIPNNASSEKKERLIVDEANMNQAITTLNLDLRLKEREEFCERVNKLFGLNISVHINPLLIQKEAESNEVYETTNPDE